ncbi:MAG: hypothetical protein BWY63_03328 [Chloroflexi bacterium ADurb.Bin360]|nr:MAG: hypothetical protein BWY63_03328 [Chloroflexi bacterium ADurb.Bin360]
MVHGTFIASGRHAVLVFTGYIAIPIILIGSMHGYIGLVSVVHNRSHDKLRARIGDGTHLPGGFRFVERLRAGYHLSATFPTPQVIVAGASIIVKHMPCFL